MGAPYDILSQTHREANGPCFSKLTPPFIIAQIPDEIPECQWEEVGCKNIQDYFNVIISLSVH